MTEIVSRVTDSSPVHLAAPRDEASCRVRTITDRVGDKWSLAVVSELRHGPRRFSDIRRNVVGINQRMLTATLRVLERDGLLARTAYPEVPPRVDYALTEMGHALLEMASSLLDWAERNADGIDEARRRYDARQRPSADGPAPADRTGRAGP